MKFKVAAIDRFTLTNANTPSNNFFQFGFTNITGGSFSALASTNLMTPSSNWTVLGSVTETSPGQFRFTDQSVTNATSRFYQVRSQ